ncbi:hypothetical protein P9112_002204 [Eukaryota sp. TZLM1-RC]
MMTDTHLLSVLQDELVQELSTPQLFRSQSTPCLFANLPLSEADFTSPSKIPPTSIPVTTTATTSVIRQSPSPEPRKPSQSTSSQGKAKENSTLGCLTRRFLHLLCEANDAQLNLNDACEVLEVPKRRIYDITNVLEGIGLITKGPKNIIHYLGVDSAAALFTESNDPSSTSPAPSMQHFDIVAEVNSLQKIEEKLDEALLSIESILDRSLADSNFELYNEDLLSLFPDRDLFLVTAPGIVSEEQIEVRLVDDGVKELETIEFLTEGHQLTFKKIEPSNPPCFDMNLFFDPPVTPPFKRVNMIDDYDLTSVFDCVSDGCDTGFRASTPAFLTVSPLKNGLFRNLEEFSEFLPQPCNHSIAHLYFD